MIHTYFVFEFGSSPLFRFYWIPAPVTHRNKVPQPVNLFNETLERELDCTYLLQCLLPSKQCSEGDLYFIFYTSVFTR